MAPGVCWVPAKKYCRTNGGGVFSRRRLVPLQAGQQVWVQDPTSKRWTTFGTVVKVKGRNYIVKMPSGNSLWRNRRHLRPRTAGDETHMPAPPTAPPSHAEGDPKPKRQATFNPNVAIKEIEPDPTPPRRSTRKRRPSVRQQDQG